VSELIFSYRLTGVVLDKGYYVLQSQKNMQLDIQTIQCNSTML